MQMTALYHIDDMFIDKRRQLGHRYTEEDYASFRYVIALVAAFSTLHLRIYMTVSLEVR